MLDTFFGYEALLEAIGLDAVMTYVFTTLVIYILVIVLFYILLGRALPNVLRKILFAVHNILAMLVIFWGPIFALLYNLYGDEISIARYFNMVLVCTIIFTSFTIRNKIFQMDEQGDMVDRARINPNP